MPRPQIFKTLFANRSAARFVCGVALCLPAAIGEAQSHPLRSSIAPFPAERFSPGSPLIRIGLMAWSASRQIALKTTSGARLIGPDGEEKAAGLGPWTVVRSGNACVISDAQQHPLGILRDGLRWRLQGEDSDGLVCVAGEGSAWKHYRGSIEISLRAGRLQVINEVALETYLRGVVSREMGRAPLEALKAQAVAARTFAVSHLGQWAAEGYDARDTTDSQVYAGADGETLDGNAAVFATTGMILMQNHAPISAQFCADCGGASLPDEKADCVHDDDAHGTARPSPPVWSFALPSQRLLALLQPALKTSPAAVVNPAPPLPDENDTLDPTAAYDPEVVPAPVRPAIVPTLDQLETLVTDASGRVRKLRYTWRAGAKDKTKGAAHQSEISGNALRSLLGVNTLRSTLFTVKKDAKGNFVFVGRGWGHGHGLCQTGAIALAAEPFHYDFRAILSRYYPAAGPGLLMYLEPEEGVVNDRTASLPSVRNAQSEAEIGRR